MRNSIEGMSNLIYFASAALIWGSTWLAIKFQLGVVDPLISIFYRFLIAALILLGFSFWRKLNLRFTLKEHAMMALLGGLLFGLNYWLVYLAELDLTSGLVAVVFSTIIFLNIINSALFLGSGIRIRVLLGAILGFTGIVLIFNREILAFSFYSSASLAFLLALLGAITASLGNITSAWLQRRKIPVIQTNAFGMLYGAMLMLLIAVLSGTPVSYDFHYSYSLSLLYLALFGSVIAFGSYLTLLGNIGPDKSAYVTLVIPIIALILSTIFESYQWSFTALAGVVIVLSGNVLVLSRKR